MAFDRKSYQREWSKRDRAKNPDKYRAAQRRHYHAHKDETRDARNARVREYYRKRLGVTPDYPPTAACELCGDPPGKKALNLDHDHSTGAFRGWLCVRCNTALGLLRDSSDLCVAAARYLRLRERKP
jgi:recombination endonuclease VII